MKQKLIFALFGIIMYVAIPKGYAQSMVIILNDGSEISSGLGTIKDLTFSSDTLFLATNPDVVSDYKLSNVRKITFNDLLDFQNSTIQQNELYVFPNPVRNELYIGNLSCESVNVSIYRLDGTLIKQDRVNSEVSSVDAAYLEEGIYFIQVGTITLKFIKI